MIHKKNIFVILILIVVIVLFIYLSFYSENDIVETYKPYHADYSKDSVNPPPKKVSVSMPDPGTFKLMDVKTSTFLNFDRSQNIAIMSEEDGVQLYIDSSSNIIYNKNSGAVGLVDFTNDNYVDNVDGRIEVSDKILTTPNASYAIDGPQFGSIKSSWIFCTTATPFVYNIYNSGGWLNVIKDANNQLCPYIMNTRNDWMIIGDANQVLSRAVEHFFTISDAISKQFLFFEPINSTCKLNDQASNFVINDTLQSIFYKNYGSYLLQDMLNGKCVTTSNHKIISEQFVVENPKLGWRLFKTNNANEFLVYNRNANGWLHSDGKSVSFGDVPTSWIFSGSGMKYFKTEQPPYLIQDDLTKKYIFINSQTNTPVLSDKATYFTNKFVNGKDDHSGVFIIDLQSKKYLVDNNKSLYSNAFELENINLFTWIYVPTEGSKYNIYKILGSTKTTDVNNALFVNYDTEKNNLVVTTNNTGKYRVWNLIYPANTKMNEPFVGSIQEGLTAPLGPMSAMSAAMSGATNNDTTKNNSSMISSIPSTPNISSLAPDLGSLMQGVPGMSPDLITTMTSVSEQSNAMPSGADATLMMQNTLKNTMGAIQNVIPGFNDANKVSILNKNVNDLQPIQQFKNPKQMNISSKNDPKDNIEGVNQYINALNKGNIIDEKKVQMTHPLGDRHFIKTNITCPKKDGTGHTDRYFLLDNMKYMKYSDGTLNTENYGLLYSAMGSLQEIDSNNLLSQLGQIENPDDPNNKCVNVTIDMKGDKKTFDSKYMTVGDCKKIDSIAFKDENKKVCEAYTNGLDIDNIYYNDNNRELNPQVNSGERAIIENDSITAFYIGSITMIGLFIFYRLLEKP